jgi:signal transduction histidine kinase
VSKAEPTGHSELANIFRPRTRLLQLLGDELIASPRLAVFELVKNAYDADANQARVTLDLRPNQEPSLTVTDDGEGMTVDIIRNVWLVPGHDYRAAQRKALVRSVRHHRLPLGEKGVGRFAVHKLGNKIQVVTRAANSQECVIEIDWRELLQKVFLSEAEVKVTERDPEVFTGDKTGTQIEINDLREKHWTRGDVRRLQRQIVSICSPFEDPAGFSAKFEVLGKGEWIEDIPEVAQILERAVWKFKFALAGEKKFDWSYEFRRIPGLKLEPRQLSGKNDHLLLPPKTGDDTLEKKVTAGESTLRGIGPVSGEFYVYDRDREVLRLLGYSQSLTDYLDENGGIRVYRDGMRVYNYGEPGDDWLGLDLRRVNIPTRRISRNIVIGAVNLSLEKSTDLVEKTNREGFVENDACDRLRRVVLGALGKLEAERQDDKESIRSMTAKGIDPEAEKIQKPIEDLRAALDKRGLRARFEPYLTKLEFDYKEMRETLLHAGMAGLNLAVVFHEVERGVRALYEAIAAGAEAQSTVRQARDLVQLLDGFNALLRRGSRARHTARKLLVAARQFSLPRLRHHRVRLSCPLLERDEEGFEARFTFGLVLGALVNLIDNSFYWLRVRWPDLPAEEKSSPRRLFLGVSEDFEDGPAIVVADTGPGFQDPPERLVRPFFTRKPDGMGLGLYYANIAMELSGGKLMFPEAEDIELPRGFDGAVIALVFGKRI